MRKLIKISLPKIEPGKIKKPKIRVVGIGGGGGNIVAELAQRVKRPSFFVANTDLQALKKISSKVKTFPFGQNLSRGLGTGMDPQLGEMAALSEKEKIKKLFQGQDLVIFIASLGGGTGSGALPVFIKISKKLGNLSYGIFTLPFEFEGEKKKEIANIALEKVKSELNALTVIPNERIFQVIEREKPLKEALSFVNKHLALSLGSLIEIIYQPGLINIDFADLKTILEGRGRFAFLNRVEISEREEASELVKELLSNPLFPYTVKGARAVLFNISGEKELFLSEISKISQAIFQSVNPEAKIIFGLSQSKISPFAQKRNGQSKIQVTIFATGCSFRIPERKISSLISKERAKKEEESKLKKESKRLLEKKPIEKETISSKSKKEAKKKKRKIEISPQLLPSKISFSPENEEAVKKEKERELEKETLSNQSKERFEAKVRKDGLQIQKEIEEAEKEILEKEKFWDIPAFLRRKSKTKYLESGG